MSDLLFREKAWEDMEYWMAYNPKLAKRIDQLLRDIGRGGFEGIGRPGPLKGDLSGFWSRRIDDNNRLLYRVRGKTVEVLSCKGRYDDK